MISIFSIVAIVNTICVIFTLLLLTLLAWMYLELVEKARRIIYAFMVDILEVLAKRSSQLDDSSKRNLELLEAGYQLKLRRLELQGKRLELLEEIK